MPIISVGKKSPWCKLEIVGNWNPDTFVVTVATRGCPEADSWYLDSSAGNTNTFISHPNPKLSQIQKILTFQMYPLLTLVQSSQRRKVLILFSQNLYMLGVLTPPLWIDKFIPVYVSKGIHNKIKPFLIFRFLFMKEVLNFPPELWISQEYKIINSPTIKCAFRQCTM